MRLGGYSWVLFVLEGSWRAGAGGFACWADIRMVASYFLLCACACACVRACARECACECACVQVLGTTLLLSGSEKRFGPRFVSAHASSSVSSQLGVSKLRLRSTPEGRKLSDNTPEGAQ